MPGNKTFQISPPPTAMLSNFFFILFADLFTLMSVRLYH